MSLSVYIYIAYDIINYIFQNLFIKSFKNKITTRSCVEEGTKVNEDAELKFLQVGLGLTGEWR